MPTLQMLTRHSTAATGLTVIFAALALCVAAAGTAHAGPLEDAAAAYEKRDFSTALNLWRPLAEQGNAEAQRGLGILYDNGFAVQKDEAQAATWLRKAAEQGDAQAEYRLGAIYVQGSNGLPHDVSRGLALMTKAAEQGFPYGQYQLAEYYRRGFFGVPKNISKAVAWHRRAADLGYAGSASRLAIMYEFGEGVPRDTVQAALLYRKAAEQKLKDAENGDVPAQLYLGRSYEWGGQGFERNEQIALLWYRRAAQQQGPLKASAERDVSRLEQKLQSESDGRR